MVAPTIGVKHVTKTIMLLTNKISIKSFRMLRTEVISWTTSEEGYWLFVTNYGKFFCVFR